MLFSRWSSCFLASRSTGTLTWLTPPQGCTLWPGPLTSSRRWARWSTSSQTRRARLHRTRCALHGATSVARIPETSVQALKRRKRGLPQLVDTKVLLLVFCPVAFWSPKRFCATVATLIVRTSWRFSSAWPSAAMCRSSTKEKGRSRSMKGALPTKSPSLRLRTRLGCPCKHELPCPAARGRSLRSRGRMAHARPPRFYARCHSTPTASG
mmetsp:Transcript_101473/g.183121  ORF Transcript_101473/g.183121 Transcript_101473/m.183121 type:complete len:210 (-) Transcript_101473:1791-2420(-)